MAILLEFGGLWALADCSRPAARAERSPTATAAAAPFITATRAQRAILATLPAPYGNADLYNGQAKFALCRACHTIAPGAGAALGPNLWGVFGRKSGTTPGYAYSEGLTRLGVTWTAETLDSWIANPRAVVPGTKMAFAGLEDPRDRVDVVAYLKTVTTPPTLAKRRGPITRGAPSLRGRATLPYGS